MTLILALQSGVGILFGSSRLQRRLAACCTVRPCSRTGSGRSLRGHPRPPSHEGIAMVRRSAPHGASEAKKPPLAFTTDWSRAPARGAPRAACWRGEKNRLARGIHAQTRVPWRSNTRSARAHDGRSGTDLCREVRVSSDGAAGASAAVRRRGAASREAAKRRRELRQMTPSPTTYRDASQRASNRARTARKS